jgi:hypothetical protein
MVEKISHVFKTLIQLLQVQQIKFILFSNADLIYYGHVFFQFLRCQYSINLVKLDCFHVQEQLVLLEEASIG